MLWLGAMNELFVVVAGKEKSTRLLVFELFQ